MKKTLIAALAFVAMVGCNKTLIESPIAESEYGYINLGITADTEMVVTKTTTEKAIDGTYRVCLQMKNLSGTFENYWTKANVDEIQSNDGYLSYSDVTSEYLTVPAGTYKIIAENIAADNIYGSSSANGQKYIKGESDDITVTAGQSVNASFKCTIQNSKVTVHKGTDFDTYFSDAVINLSCDDHNFYMDWYSAVIDTKSGETKYNEVYFPASQNITWELNVTMKGSTTQKKYTNSDNDNAKITTIAAEWKQITFSPNTGDKGAINVTITVTDDFGQPATETVTLNPVTGGEVVPTNN